MLTTGLVLTDLLSVTIGLAMIALVARTLGRGLGGLWGKDRVVTQALVRMMKVTFVLIASAWICVQVVWMPAAITTGCSGGCVVNSASSNAQSLGAADIILAVATRFGAACLVVGALYLVPVFAGFRWRRAHPSPVSAEPVAPGAA